MSDQQMKQLLQRIEELFRAEVQKPLTVGEAAKYMGVSKSYLYKLTSQGAIEFYKPNGKLIYFLVQDLIKWMLRKKCRA